MTEKTKPKPKTTAQPDAVFNYCFFLASKGEKPTYQKLAEKFGASNDMVGPLLKQWEELHAQQPDWQLPESVRERLEETILTIWRIASTAAMGQLQVQAQLLKDEVEQKTVQMKALQQALDQQAESLAAKDSQLQQLEEQMMAATDLGVQTEHALAIEKNQNQRLNEQLQKLQAQESQYRQKELDLAKLQGQHEELRRQIEQLQAQQGGPK